MTCPRCAGRSGRQTGPTVAAGQHAKLATLLERRPDLAAIALGARHQLTVSAA